MESHMRKMFCIALLSTVTLAGACGKKKDGDGGADKADKGDKDKGGDTSSLPPLKEDPDPGAITAADKPPFESVKFRMMAKRSDKGWPNWNAYNYGNKPVVFMAVYGYAYDKDGKQVARTSVPLSWNGKIAPGGKTDWDIQLGGMGDPVPASAASYEACYNSIKFDGDANMTDDNARCPEKKEKGK